MTIVRGQMIFHDPNNFFETEMIESQSYRADNGYDFTDVLERRALPAGFVVNINKADEEDLKRLNLNDIQIQNLFNYLKDYGELTSIYEMNLIEGFDSTLLEELKPNIAFSFSRDLYPISIKSVFEKGRHTFLFKEQRVMQHQKGYGNMTGDTESNTPSDSLSNDPAYKGSPDKMLFKYGYNYHDRLRWGITLEKDAGEALSNGIDYIGFHCFYSGTGIIKRFTVGDYNVHFGHGLTMGTGFNIIFDPLSGSWINGAGTITPSTAANEGMSLRGAAISLSPIRKLNLSIFYSTRKLDASTDEDSTDSIMGSDYSFYSENSVRSIIETGLHRTDRELSLKGQLGQRVLGGNVNTRFRFIRLGATAALTSFNPGISRKENSAKQFQFSGDKLLTFGTDISITLKSMVLFSEFSGSDNGAKALIAGLKYGDSGDHGVTIFYRNYDKDYHNFFSSGWLQSSDCSNERGFYGAFWVKPSSAWMISAGADIYSFPWLKYNTDAPANGSEYFFRNSIEFNKLTLLTFKYTLKENPVNQTDAITHTRYPSSRLRHNLRLEFNYSPLVSLKFKDRIETTCNVINSEKTNGFLISHDIEYSKESYPVKLNFRYLLFDTDSYNDRIYTYENDLLYSWSVPSFSGKGSRFYTMLRYNIGHNAALWLKYSLTTYSDRDTVGTGNDESNGNMRSEIRMQLIVKI